jgi:hypothetical protein
VASRYYLVTIILWQQDNKLWPQDNKLWPQEFLDNKLWPQDNKLWPQDNKLWPQDKKILQMLPLFHHNKKFKGIF